MTCRIFIILLSGSVLCPAKDNYGAWQLCFKKKGAAMLERLENLTKLNDLRIAG